jgi:hypothetical protein
VALAAAVDAAAVVCGGWLGWADRLAEVDGAADLAALEVDDLPAGHADVRAVGEARALLAGAAVALWEVEGPDGLAERRPLESIADAHALLAGVGGGEGEDGTAEPVADEAAAPVTASGSTLDECRQRRTAIAPEPPPSPPPQPRMRGSDDRPRPGRPDRPCRRNTRAVDTSTADGDARSRPSCPPPPRLGRQPGRSGPHDRTLRGRADEAAAP